MKKVKLSHYVIVTDPLKDANSKRILYSTRSGKTLMVPEICYEYLLEGRFDEIPKPVVDKLIETQALVSADEDELLSIVTDNKNSIDNESNEGLYVVIQPSASCQLGCYYCGQQHTKDYIAPDLYEKIAARVRQKASEGNYKLLNIAWFGAEPLMGLQQIRALTKSFKQIAHDFNLTYEAKMVTNGLSLKESIFEEIATTLSVKKIEVTLDGTAEYHDTHRYTKEGGKSFDLIFQNLQKILSRADFSDLGCAISIRCNVDEKNYEGVSKLIHLLSESGLHKKIAYFYPIGVYAWGNEAHKKSLTKEEFAQHEIAWLVEMIKMGFTPGLKPSRTKQVCMSVSKNAEMYDAFGNISNCTEVSYVPQYTDSDYFVGNIKDDPATFKPRNFITDWNDTLLTDKFPCHSCKMLPVCGGACPKSWHEDMRACPNPKFNIKDRLALMHLLATTNIDNRNEKLDKFMETRQPVTSLTRKDFEEAIPA
jgi:uncharacterized protein